MSQSHRRRVLPWAASLALAALMLAGCELRTNTQGNLVDSQLLEQVKPGALNKDQVETLLGPPSSVSTFDHTTWYYIAKQTRQIAFFDPEVLEQKVIEIEFDKEGTVKAIHKFGPEDGRDVEIVDRTTPSRGKQAGIFDSIWQLFMAQIGNNNVDSRDPFYRH